MRMAEIGGRHLQEAQSHEVLTSVDQMVLLVKRYDVRLPERRDVDVVAVEGDDVVAWERALLEATERRVSNINQA